MPYCGNASPVAFWPVSGPPMPFATGCQRPFNDGPPYSAPNRLKTSKPAVHVFGALYSIVRFVLDAGCESLPPLAALIGMPRLAATFGAKNEPGFIGSTNCPVPVVEQPGHALVNGIL